MAAAATDSIHTRRRRSKVKSARAVGPVRRDEPEAAGWFERTPVILLVVFVALFALSLAKHPGGYLSTDTGPKVATVDAMSSADSIRPVIGYWASEADPDGVLHPFGHNLRPLRTSEGDAAYVVVTTLPMLYLAQPLYDLGGLRLALLIPVISTVATAAAAGALSRRLGSPTGAPAAWIVGLGSPAAVYALDFWEHASGLALMAWALVAMVESVRVSVRWHLPLLAGLAFGVAASLRQEAMIYGVVVGGVATLVLIGSDHPRLVPKRLGLFGVGGLSALAVNAWLESAVIGETARVDRSLGTLDTSAVLFVDRMSAGLTTLGSPGGGHPVVVLVYAAWFLGSLGGLGYALSRGWEAKRMGLIAGCAYLVLALNWIVYGSAFLSGMVVAAPLAGIGIGLLPSLGSRRMVWWVSVAALPLVLAFQYVQGAGPQWGGRYLLASGFGLTVVAVTALEKSHRRTLGLAGALSFVVTTAGVAWTIERSHAFGGTGRELAQHTEPLVFIDPFLPQEFGTVALDGRWLVARDADERELAFEVLAALGTSEFSLVEVDRRRDLVDFGDARPTSNQEFVPLVGNDRLRITTFVIDR